MKFYFSGVGSEGDAAMLERAGVEHVLADQFDIGYCGAFKHLALDSGAFRASRKGLSLSVDEYLEATLDIQGEFDFVVSLDVIGNPEASYANWTRLRSGGLNCIPVWHFDYDRTYLERYIGLHDGIVGIGGLAAILREKDKAREIVLKQLVKLCEKYPNRFHLFGLNWVKAINELQDGLHSGDSSLWLRGARYGAIIFKNSRSNKLSQCPSWILDEWAQKNGKDPGFIRTRSSMCKANARSIDNYCRKEVVSE